MTTLIDNQLELGEAARIWTGWGKSASPIRDDIAMIERFGVAKSQTLLKTLKLLEEDFYSSDARYTANGLRQMAEISSFKFKEKHTRVPKEVVEAFAWCYTFDFK